MNAVTEGNIPITSAMNYEYIFSSQQRDFTIFSQTENAYSFSAVGVFRYAFSQSNFQECFAHSY